MSLIFLNVELRIYRLEKGVLYMEFFNIILFGVVFYTAIIGIPSLFEKFN